MQTRFLIVPSAHLRLRRSSSKNASIAGAPRDGQIGRDRFRFASLTGLFALPRTVRLNGEQSCHAFRTNPPGPERRPRRPGNKTGRVLRSGRRPQQGYRLPVRARTPGVDRRRALRRSRPSTTPIILPSSSPTSPVSAPASTRKRMSRSCAAGWQNNSPRSARISTPSNTARSTRRKRRALSASEPSPQTLARHDQRPAGAISGRHRAKLSDRRSADRPGRRARRRSRGYLFTGPDLELFLKAAAAKQARSNRASGQPPRIPRRLSAVPRSPTERVLR